MKKNIIKTSLFFIYLGMSFFSFAGGEESNINEITVLEDGWRFAATPYFWMGEVSTKITVNKVNHTASVPFDTIFSNYNLSYFLHTEVGYDAWSLFLDSAYIPIYKGSSPGVKSSISNVDAGLYYRFYSQYLPSDHYVSLELMGGARYFAVGSTLYMTPSNLSAGASMVAPILGLRLKSEFTSNFDLWLLGDAGGFGVNGLNSTWGVTVGMSYLVRRYIRVAIAYKILKLNYEKPASGFDGLIYGPMIGVTFSSNSR